MPEGSSLEWLQKRIAEAEHPAPLPEPFITGPFPGTPEKMHITQTCLMGYHEKTTTIGACPGGGWITASKKWLCYCACHAFPRGITPGTDFDPPRPEADPLRITLSDELRMWANRHKPKEVREKQQSTVDDSTFHEDSGRRGRGSLEKQVDLICRDYAKGGLDSLETRDELPEDSALLTPRIIAKEIAFVYGQELPSEGAIRAIFYRWRDIGYAFVSEKPLGFMLLTPLGIELGLERCKDRAR